MLTQFNLGIGVSIPHLHTQKFSVLLHVRFRSVGLEPDNWP